MKTNMEKTYLDRVHTWGRIWSICSLMALMAVPAAICIHFDAWPELTDLLVPIGKVMLLNWTTAVVEVVAYTPMLGAGGTYLSFVTGNICNLKLPCGLNAMAEAGVKANTDEGEVISTIAIASSAITTTVVIAAGVLLFGPAISELKDNEIIAPAFSYVLPALFGALGAGYFRKNIKISLVTILIGVVVLLFKSTLGVGTLIFVTVFVACLSGIIMYKLGWLDDKKVS